MKTSIKVNDDTYLLTRDIKFVREVPPEEQAAISERYQVDGTQFKCAITLRNSNRPFLVEVTTTTRPASARGPYIL